MANNNNVKGTEKVLQKLKESVDNANYYEAHQMYRTVCRRYIKQKKYSNAAELLFSGAQTLLKHRQGGSGTDLALYMIEAYNEEKLPVTDESRSRIIQLLELFSPNEIGRKKFIDAAVSWSVKFGESPVGDPELHHYVGELFWKDKSYPEAEPHFLAGTSESSKSYGKMLAEWSEKDQFDKSGLYIARAVLQYLCLRSIKDAKISFDTFVSSKQQQQSNDIKKGVAEYRPTITGDPIEIPIYSLPLLNFLQLLILTVQRDAADLFVSLKNKYKSVLSIDQSENLLNKIGDVFFNIKPQRPQQPFNVFQDLMNNLFQGPMMGGGGGGGGGGRFGGSSSSASQSNSHSRINSSSELD